MVADKTPKTRKHKLGSNRNELAKKPKKIKSPFSESRDVREDRGMRHKKFSHPRPSTRSS